MTEDTDRELQLWFARSIQELPGHSFTRAALGKVRRKERMRQLQLYLAVAVACLGVCLLLPDLMLAINRLAALPLTVIAASRDQWPWFAPLVAGIGCWLVYRARARVVRRNG